jgi:hypothetical protein
MNYLFQFGMIFKKFFSIQLLKIYQQNRNNYFNSKKQEKITKQCKKAAQEITYLKFLIIGVLLQARKLYLKLL